MRSRTLPSSQRSYSRKNILRKMVIFNARIPRPLVLGIPIKAGVTAIAERSGDAPLDPTILCVQPLRTSKNLMCRGKSEAAVGIIYMTAAYNEGRGISLRSTSKALTSYERVYSGKSSR